MPIVRGLGDVTPRHRGAVLTIGNFDGVHLGHQKIVRTVLETAAPLGAPTLAMTFEPHPMKLLVPDRGVKLLTPLDEKVRLLARYGMEAVLVVFFDREFAHLAPDAFIEEVLVRRLAPRAVVVGHNYAFGKGKKGTTDLLRRRGTKYGFKVRVVRSATYHGDVVSSSRIRSLIGWGRVCEAAGYLGRPYSIRGTVVKGAGRGAKLLGTPTANLDTCNEVVPREGVYAVRVAVGGALWDGVANIGRNPTFEVADQSYEVHLFDFQGDLRGRDLTVFFMDRLREERTYPSAEALKEQIIKDIDTARRILKKTQVRPPAYATHCMEPDSV